MKIYVISRGARSLIIIIIWNGILKARYYNFSPLLFGGNYYILVIFAKNMHQQTVYFRAPDAKFLLPWEGIHPSQILPLSVASLPRSSPRRSAHPDFRIPRKNSSYGPAYTCLQIICYVRRCSVLNSRRTSHLSVVLPSPLFFLVADLRIWKSERKVSIWWA